RELGEPRRVELAPRAPAIVVAMERRRPASGEQNIRILRMHGDGPDVAHRRFEPRPARRALVPAVSAIVGAGIERFRIARVSAQRPDARFEVKARVAVRMHPGLAEIIAEPYGMPSGARVNPDVLLHRSAIIQRMRPLFAIAAALVCSAVSAQ